MMRLHPGAEAIISWEPDCSPQVMTANPSQSSGTAIMVNQRHLCLGLFNYGTFVPYPQFFCLLKPITHTAQKMAEDELSVYSASFHGTSPAM
jgi:hypothetical protein